jgi:hypothetical protein
VNNLANIAVANAVANGLMQHPDQPQHSHSVSSDTEAFFRAQGVPVTLELPLPEDTTNRTTADRSLVSSEVRTQNFNYDYQIRAIANSLGLHQNIGPAPSVEMLLRELALMSQKVQSFLPMKNPLLTECWNFWPVGYALDTWHLRTDNPRWGNNAEASTSSRYRRPRLKLIREGSIDRSEFQSVMETVQTCTPQSDSHKDLVIYDHEFAAEQIMKQLHPERNIEKQTNSADDFMDLDQVTPDDLLLEDFTTAGYTT